MFKTNKNKKEKSSKKTFLFWSLACAILFLLLIFLILLCQTPQPKLAMNIVDGLVSIDSEVKIKFNWPVSRQVKVQLEPQVYGEIDYGDNLYKNHFSRSVFIKPELTWLPGTTYQIIISQVKGVWPAWRQPKEYTLTFTTVSSPNIISVSPEQKEEIGPSASWQAKLDRANVFLADYEFKFEPAVEAEIILSSDKKTYDIKPKNPLSQGQTYKLEILKKTVRYLFGTAETAYQSEPASVFKGSWQVKEAPGIVSFSPQGSIVPLSEKISVTFSENIDIDSFKQNTEITPELSGSWETDDYRTIIFKSATFTKDTNYTVRMKAGTKTYGGGFLPEDAVHSFTTLGAVKLASSSPANGSQGISINSAMRLTFDQPVDHASAESKFSLTPAVNGSISWDSQTMIYKPSTALSYNTTYIVKLAPGIKSQAGFDSEKELTVSFSTELSVTKLSVPFHRQEHNLSCEVATLVMVLAFRDVSVTETALISAIGFDPTPKKNGIWGNPHIAFVGDIDGHQPSSGYGVYWQPIAAAAQKYRSARIITGGGLTDLTGEIKKGNPIIVWGTAGSGTRIDWKTKDGENVVAVSGEHTRVVIGFIGPADNPVKIITLDPLSGEKHFTKDSFLWNWGRLNNSGVVVE